MQVERQILAVPTPGVSDSPDEQVGPTGSCQLARSAQPCLLGGDPKKQDCSLDHASSCTWTSGVPAAQAQLSSERDMQNALKVAFR